MAKYPWEEIKAKYETGKYSIKELAEEYGFNASYGRRKAKKNSWEKGKSNKKVTEEAAKKVLEEEAEKEAELREEYAKIIKNIRRGLANELFAKGNPDFDNLKCFKIATQALKNCRSEDWEIHEIQEVAKKVEQEIGADITHGYNFEDMTDEEILKEADKYGIDIE